MYWTIALLSLSNIFMTFAWYGHLKYLHNHPLWFVIFVSWGIALLEYCFQVPGNRIGANYYSLPQLKIIQEVITLVIFAFFSVLVMNVKLSWNYLWAALCMVGAVYFIFQEGR